MRVLLTAATMAMGGAERVVVELAKGLRAGGDQVAVAADHGPLDPALEAAGVTRFTTAGYGRSPISAARGTLGVRKAIRSFRPDVIHSHNVKSTALVAAARASVRPRPPLVATFHGVRREEYRAAALILRAPKIVVCVSEDVASGLARSGLGRDRLRVIPNAVPAPEPLTGEVRDAIDRELGLEGAPVVSLVGRLVPQKAPERFLAAAALIAAEVPGCRFLIVGDGPLRDRLEADAGARDIDGAVRFTGIRPDARSLISRSDVIVFSSDWEGMSLVALEALAAGTPVVATDVEGMRQLMGTGAGVLVGRDAPPLARAVIDLLNDPERRDEMGRRGRELIAVKLSLERMVDAYRELYRELASPRALTSGPGSPNRA
jgi:glycosyltransferase involved in cell wall biosynthesis